MEILNQFGINPLLLAAQVVNFLILLFILKKFLFKPILKVLDERKERIEGSLKNAEEIEKKLLLTEEEKDKIIAKTTKEMDALMEQTKKEIEIMKQEGKVQAEQLATQIIKVGEETAKSNAEKMEKEVLGRFAEILAKGMEKVSGESFSRADRQKMIDKTVKNLS